MTTSQKDALILEMYKALTMVRDWNDRNLFLPVPLRDRVDAALDSWRKGEKA